MLKGYAKMKIVKGILLILGFSVAAALFAAVLAVLNSGYLEQQIATVALEGVERTIAYIDEGKLSFLDGLL